MTLPDLILSSRINQNGLFSEIDSANLCLDLAHFKSYPHAITYNYNSRGFRDQEWPIGLAELKDAVWCIGDSFTVGLGSPIAHTWVTRLAARSGRRIINVSMDGASNEWIARRAQAVATAVNPGNLVIMWSYVHRREHKNHLLSDEHRRLPNVKSTVVQDWENLLECKRQVDQTDANVVHLAVPNAITEFCPLYHQLVWNQICGPDWPSLAPRSLNELAQLPDYIISEITHLHKCLDTIQLNIEMNTKLGLFCQVKRLDLARDGHHFDLITADWAASYVANLLK